MDRLSLLDDPQVRPFLPMLYVAWADADLDDADRDALTAEIRKQPWLRPAARDAISKWLDPQKPPSSAELARILEVVRQSAGTLGKRTRRSLADLAMALGEEGDLAVRDAIQTIAAVLGVSGSDVADLGLAEATEETIATSRVDAAHITRVLDGSHIDVRQRVRAFLDSPERRAYGLPKDEYRALVLGWLRELADGGLPRLAYPGVTSEAKDLSGFMVAFEMLAHGDLSLLVKCGVQFGLFGGSLFFLGTERHRALLPRVASCDLLGCFAMSEVGHGSNVAGLETIARYDAKTKELVLHTPSESARKEWIGGAARDARYATVFTQLEVGGQSHGVHALLVRIRDDAGNAMPGVRIGDSGLKMGLNGVDNGRLWFDEVRVPRDGLLDRFATITEDGQYESPIASPGKRFFTMLGTLVGGRLCVGSAAVSVAKTALAIAVRYSEARRQFGPTGGREVPLLAYPTQKRRLLPALATTYVLSLAFESLRAAYVRSFAESAPDTRELEAITAGLKAAASWHATKTVQLSREACGAQGYLAINRLPDLKADSDVFATFEGDNIVLMQLVARSLLTGFSRQFSGDAVTSVLKLVGRHAGAALRKNPITTRQTDPEHLRDRAFHLALLRHREDSLVESAARRMKARLDRGMDAHAALLEVQEHLVACAEAHVERVALEWFASHIEPIEDADTRALLDRVGHLHALSLFEARSAWFLEDGSFAPEKARAIRKEVEKLCAELTPDARALVDAFAIPDACLAAPIAFFDPASPPL